MNRLIFFTFILFAISCSTDAEREQYQLAVQVFPEGSGTVSPENELIDSDKEIELMAYPNASYDLFEWQGDLIGDENPSSLIIDSDKNITAHFKNTTVQNFGGSGSDYATDIALKSDGGIVLVGTSNSNDGSFSGMNNGAMDAFLIALDHEMNITMRNMIGGSEIDEATSLAVTADGDYVVTGNFYSNDGDFYEMNNRNTDIFISKINQNGQTEWLSTLGGTDTDISRTLIQVDDGYLIAGYTQSSELGVENVGRSDILVAKFDKIGQKIWVKTFGGSGSEEVRDLIKVEGGFLLTGGTTSEDGDFEGDINSRGDIFLIKLSDEGDLIWKKTYGDSDSEISESIVTTDGNDYLLVGNTETFDAEFGINNNSQMDILVMKVDAQGETKWVKTFGGRNNDRAVQSTIVNNGDILITGYSNSGDGDFFNFTSESYGIFLLKLDAEGNKQWIKSYAGSSHDISNALLVGPNQEIYILAESSSNDGDFNVVGYGWNDIVIVSITD